MLGISSFTLIELNPFRPNIYLDIKKKEGDDIEAKYENIIVNEIKRLSTLKENYPVTLLFCNFKYMSLALKYCKCEFGNVTVNDSLFGALYSKQDEFVTKCITEDLMNEHPRKRLVFSTSVSGMGFDSKCINNIIHSAPPRNIIEYLQQIGRSGRRDGSKATAVLYWSPSDIMISLPGMKEDMRDYCKSSSCLWENLLVNFGFKKPDTGLPLHECCIYCTLKCKCTDCVTFDVSQMKCSSED